MLTNCFQSHHKLFRSLSLHKISKDNLEDKCSLDLAAMMYQLVFVIKLNSSKKHHKIKFSQRSGKDFIWSTLNL